MLGEHISSSYMAVNRNAAIMAINNLEGQFHALEKAVH